MKKIKISVISIFLASSAFASDKNIDACFSYLKGQDYQKAIASGKKAVKSSSKTFDSHFCLGVSYTKSGEFKLALTELNNAVSVATNKKDLAAAASYLGITYNDMGETEKAVIEYNRQLVINRELNDPRGIASALSNIAGTYQDKLQHDKALQYYQESLEINPSELGKATTYNNIASLLREQQKYDEAEKYQLESIKLAERAGDYHAQATYLIGLGNIQYCKDDYKAAEATLLDGLKKIRTVGDLYWEGQAELVLGRLYKVQGMKTPATEHYKMAMAIFTKSGSKSYLNAAQQELNDLLK